MHWTMVLVLTQTMVYWTIVVPSKAKACFFLWMLHVGYEPTYHSQKQKEFWISKKSYTFKTIPCTIICHLWSPLLFEMECRFVIFVLSRNKGKYWKSIHFFVDFLDLIVISEIARVYNWWIKHLKLCRNDHDVLLDESELNVSTISACHQLLSKQYSKIVVFKTQF